MVSDGGKLLKNENELHCFIGKVTTKTDDTVLYAHWELIAYTITYELDGGTNNSNNPLSYTVEDNIIIFTAPEKEEYYFIGWKDAEGNYVTYINCQDMSNVIIYAEWI